MQTSNTLFEEGNILYFIVLKCVDTQVVIASLPTSHDHIPSTKAKEHGCIDDAAINFNCYYFQEKRLVARNDTNNTGFAFPRDTYVYGYRLNFFDIRKFQSQVTNNQTTIKFIGKLYKQEMANIIECLKKLRLGEAEFQTSIVILAFCRKILDDCELLFSYITLSPLTVGNLIYPVFRTVQANTDTRK
jgi:hypothetical protein